MSQLPFNPEKQLVVPRNLICLSAPYCCLALLWMGGFTPSSATAEELPDEPTCVVLLHGLGRSSISMKGVEWRLEREGYTVVNKSYPWINFSIDELAAIAVEPGLEDCQQLDKSSVHFVTHSLGGILLRQYLADKPVSGLGRVVMLAPPNQGSAMAEHLLANEMLEPLMPRAAHELGTGEDSVPRQLGPVHFELGVIAGNNTRMLLSPGLDGIPNDGTVAVAETRVDGMQDFIVLDVDHSFLMWRKAVLDQVVLFLREGHFDHSLSPANEELAQTALAACAGDSDPSACLAGLATD